MSSNDSSVAPQAPAVKRSSFVSVNACLHSGPDLAATVHLDGEPGGWVATVDFEPARHSAAHASIYITEADNPHMTTLLRKVCDDLDTAFASVAQPELPIDADAPEPPATTGAATWPLTAAPTTSGAAPAGAAAGVRA